LEPEELLKHLYGVKKEHMLNFEGKKNNKLLAFIGGNI
jgi:hypothetical protein